MCHYYLKQKRVHHLIVSYPEKKRGGGAKVVEGF